MTNDLPESERFSGLAERIARACLSPRKGDLADILRGICQLLHDEVEGYDWVGFYLVDPPGSRELALGPFVGAPTEHVRIPFGKGVCGRAAELRSTVVVDDVSRESNYLACSLNVRSEIVLPIFRKDELVGELDIDSHQLSRFGSDDRAFLSRVVETVSAVI